MYTSILQQINIKKYNKGGNLLSREQGHRISEIIKKELNKLQGEEILFLDFQHIRYATPACLNEILISLNRMEKNEFKDKYTILLLKSSNRDLKESFIFILKEICGVIMCFDEKGKWEILGEITKAQRDTLKIVIKKKEITSTELSTLFNIPINAASNRLKDLYSMKLVKRSERILPFTGGRQFIYRSLIC